jgi:hypothetical protein
MNCVGCEKKCPPALFDLRDHWVQQDPLGELRAKYGKAWKDKNICGHCITDLYDTLFFCAHCGMKESFESFEGSCNRCKREGRVEEVEEAEEEEDEESSDEMPALTLDSSEEGSEDGGKKVWREFFFFFFFFFFLLEEEEKGRAGGASRPQMPSVQKGASGLVVYEREKEGLRGLPTQRRLQRHFQSLSQLSLPPAAGRPGCLRRVGAGKDAAPQRSGGGTAHRVAAGGTA